MAWVIKVIALGVEYAELSCHGQSWQQCLLRAAGRVNVHARQGCVCALARPAPLPFKKESSLCNQAESQRTKR